MSLGIHVEISSSDCVFELYNIEPSLTEKTMGQVSKCNLHQANAATLLAIFVLKEADPKMTNQEQTVLELWKIIGGL